MQDRNIADFNLKSIAQATSLFSGADLGALIDQLVDLVIEEIFKSKDDRALQVTRIRALLSSRHSTTLDWLNRAKNCVEFANQNEFYSVRDQLLRTPEVRKWKI